MIQPLRRAASGKTRPWSSSPLAKHYDRLAAAGYPWFIAVNRFTYFVDENGLICGICQLGENAGRRRIDCPEVPPNEADIAAVMEWAKVRELVAIKCPSVSSYAVKHWAERWRRDYVPNGAAIIAFARLGFRQSVTRGTRAELNTAIGIAAKSYKHLPEYAGRRGGGR